MPTLMSWQSQMDKARKRKPTEQSMTVCVDDAAAEAYLVAAAEHNRIRREALGRVAKDAATSGGDTLDRDAVLEAADADPAVLAAAAAVDTARAARDEATIGFTFRSLSPDAFDLLVAEHPPRDDNADDARYGYNVETFRPALVAACHVHYERADDGTVTEQDGMTGDDAVELFTSSGWSAADRDQLFATAWAVNQTPRLEFADLGKG